MGLHSNITCITTELSNNKPYQRGGTGVALSQTMAPRVIGIGEDTSRLRRWNWTTLQGKYRTIMVISAYISCKSSTAGVQTVYEQHARSLYIQQEPRQ